jgi:uncharacterized membrane protein
MSGCHQIANRGTRGEAVLDRRWAPLVPAIVAGGAYSFVSILRYDRFGAHAFDLGIFDQAVWGYSRFELIPNTVKGTSNLLGDHFSPIVALAAPLYWAWDDPRALLVLQALLLVSSSLPLFFFARRRLPPSAALLIQTAYLGFVGVWSAALFDFHEVAFAAPLVALALWALDVRRLWLFVACCVLGALVKEDVVLLFATLALYGAFIDSTRRFGVVHNGHLRRIGVRHLLVSSRSFGAVRSGAVQLGMAALLAVWFLLLTRVVMPALSGHAYGYSTVGRIFTDDGTKLLTLLALFGSWCFVPLRSPLALLTVVPLAERMLNTNSNYWTLHFHYSLTVAPILAFAAADGLARMRSRAPTSLAAIAAASTFAISAATLAGSTTLPLSASAAAATNRCLATIPAGASVVATSGLVPHVSRRRMIYTFASRPRATNPDFVAVNATAPAGPLGKNEIGVIVNRSLRRKYHVACKGGGTLVLTRD